MEESARKGFLMKTSIGRRAEDVPSTTAAVKQSAENFIVTREIKFARATDNGMVGIADCLERDVCDGKDGPEKLLVPLSRSLWREALRFAKAVHKCIYQKNHIWGHFDPTTHVTTTKDYAALPQKSWQDTFYIHIRQAHTNPYRYGMVVWYGTTIPVPP